MLRDQWRGWDHLEVLLSLVYRLLRCLFGLLVGHFEYTKETHEGQFGPFPEAVEELATLVEFIFLERPGYPVRAHPEIPGLRLHRCDGHLLAINSTELRERTRRNLSLDYFVPHKAIVYIREKRLYREQ